MAKEGLRQGQIEYVERSDTVEDGGSMLIEIDWYFSFWYSILLWLGKLEVKRMVPVMILRKTKRTLGVNLEIQEI